MPPLSHIHNMCMTLPTKIFAVTTATTTTITNSNCQCHPFNPCLYLLPQQLSQPLPVLPSAVTATSATTLVFISAFAATTITGRLYHCPFPLPPPPHLPLTTANSLNSFHLHPSQDLLPLSCHYQHWQTLQLPLPLLTAFLILCHFLYLQPLKDLCPWTLLCSQHLNHISLLYRSLTIIYLTPLPTAHFFTLCICWNGWWV